MRRGLIRRVVAATVLAIGVGCSHPTDRIVGVSFDRAYRTAFAIRANGARTVLARTCDAMTTIGTNVGSGRDAVSSSGRWVVLEVNGADVPANAKRNQGSTPWLVSSSGQLIAGNEFPSVLGIPAPLRNVPIHWTDGSQRLAYAVAGGERYHGHDVEEDVPATPRSQHGHTCAHVVANVTPPLEPL